MSRQLDRSGAPHGQVPVIIARQPSEGRHGLHREEGATDELLVRPRAVALLPGVSLSATGGLCAATAGVFPASRSGAAAPATPGRPRRTDRLSGGPRRQRSPVSEGNSTNFAGRGLPMSDSARQWPQPLTDRDGVSRGIFAEFTPSAAHNYDSWFNQPWGAHAWAVELAAVDGALPDRPDQTVVEVGCGTGRLAAHLTRRAATVLGVDSSLAMLAVATDRAPGRLVCADGRRLPLPNGVADVAITIATLEFTDASAVLDELARITRPGGRIIALTLNPVSPWGLLDRPTRRAPFSTAAFLTRTELRRLGSRHGRVRLRGRLFTAARPRFLRRLEPIAAVLGCAAPWFGAVQVLDIDKPV